MLPVNYREMWSRKTTYYPMVNTALQILCSMSQLNTSVWQTDRRT